MGQTGAPETLSQPVAIELLSGRAFTAQVDPQTDETLLWLLWSRKSASVSRPIRWERVVRVKVAGEVLSGEAFRQAIKLFRQRSPKPETESAETKQSGLKRPKNADASPAVPANRTTDTGAENNGQVRSLAIDARVANWDADVEADGLVVDVYPLSGNGTVLPIDGTLRVHWTGEWTGDARKRRRPFLRLGDWTEQVREGDFDVRGATYRLPFGRIHPEFDLGTGAHAVVHARLTVPGHGVFETSRSTVRIRPYSALRDRLQQATGRRFFPIEQVSQGMR